MHINGKTIWVVGASQGIGLCLVESLLKDQCCVVASSRNAEQNPELIQLKQRYPGKIALIDCDIGERDSLPPIIEQAWSQFDGIDIWLYNVGSYQPMTIADWEIEKFEQMNQSNYLGAVYLMHGLWPKFEQQGFGEWVWNASLASDFGLPYGGGYSAPKAALMNLAESLYPELLAHNIRLKVINHGFVKTRLTAKNDFPMLGLMSAQDAADRIVKALQQNRFETRFPFNLGTVLLVLKRLPKSWSLFLTKKMLRKPNHD